MEELGNVSKGGFFVGESVVKVGGVGALIGTNPKSPFPGWESLGLRRGFMGDGLRVAAEEGCK